MKRNKITIFLLCTLLFSLIFMPKVSAEEQTGYLIGNNVPFTSNPNIESPSRSDYVAPGVLHLLDKGDEIKSTGTKVASTVSSCKTEFYQVSYIYVKNGKTYTGYICGDAIQFNVDTTPYEEEFEKAGFPKSYWKYLTILKEQHPNWTFKAFQTGISWNEALKNQAVVGKSLIHKNYIGNGGYLSTSSEAYNYYTDTWQEFDGYSWYAANSQTIGYYMDPRNFLTEMNVFMFEDLSYQKENQTKELVEKILTSDFLKQHADSFMKGAENFQISPVHLASRVRQEIGTTESVVTSGASFSYNGNNYESLYNFYNIGATSGEDNWKKGLIWANGGEKGESTSYGRPWNTPEKSILGGAEFLAKSYIAKGQNTIYFQKWNVVTENPFTNQYMTNIMAPMSEASTAFNSYNEMGLIQSGEEGLAFTFTIPVYQDMPEDKVNLPTVGNPNNYLKTLTVNGKAIDNFDAAKTEYTIYATGTTAEVKASTVNSGSKISGTGTISLKEKETKITLTVTAQNGSEKKYQLTIIRTDEGTISIPDVISEAGFRLEEDQISKLTFSKSIASLKSDLKKIYGSLQISITDSNGNSKADDKMIGTGDNIKIEVNGQSKTYKALVYGDVNGDGKLDLNDILSIQKHYIKLNGYQLSGVYYKAGNVDRSGNIDLNDLLQFQRQYVHLGTIQQ